jgi:hypothetical protein
MIGGRCGPEELRLGGEVAGSALRGISCNLATPARADFTKVL